MVRRLELVPGQELQLECGKEINTVTRYLEDRSEDRLLELIKCLEAHVSLKCDAAPSASANAVER
jgi:hypothetical protein